MYPAELEQLIRQGETQDVEFESSIPGPQSIAKHVAALANTNGGMLILGVQEPGEVVGINQHRAREVIEQSRPYLSPAPVMNVQSLQIREHTVVVVQVSPSEELHSAMGGYFGRGARPTAVLENREGATRPMNPSEIREHALKGKTEDAALSRLATVVADQTRTIAKQTETIDKLSRDSKNANSPWTKLALALGGVIAGVILISIVSCAALAQAPEYPSRPVRMLVGFAPGGATDIIARQVAYGLTESLGQSVVVENRPGASSQIAGDLVAKSAPDGHTLLMTTQTLMTSMIIENRTYPDLTRDFVAVSLCATSPLILVTHPSVPARSLQDLIALVRSRPGLMNYASGGVGTTPHLGGEMLANMAKLKIVHIPYKGEAPGITDVLAGHVPFMFSNVTASNAHVQAGKLRALAVTGLQRTPAVPGVPTLNESGLPGFEVIGFFGVMAPAATPPQIVARLNGEIAKILARADTRERFATQALEPGSMSAAQYGDYIKSEAEKWGKLIKEAGITAK